MLDLTNQRVRSAAVKSVKLFMPDTLPQGEDLKTDAAPKGKELKTALHYKHEPLGRKPDEGEELRK